jgi:translation initiation factor IF-1
VKMEMSPHDLTKARIVYRVDANRMPYVPRRRR